MEEVLEKIRTGEVRMKPRLYFTCKIVLLVLVTFITLITSAFLISYMIFSLSIGGRMILLGFGWKGVQIFLITFPWALLLAELILLYILELLVKHFRFGYRSPVVYIIGGLFSLSIISGIFINATPIHGFLMERAYQKQLPPVFGGMYDHVRRPPRERGVCRGVVTSIQEHSFTLREDDSDDSERTIFTPPHIDISTFIKVGDTVFVASDTKGSTTRAYGIRKISKERY